MIEIARILAGIAVISLILAMVAGIGPLGRRQLRRLDGAAALDDRCLQIVAYLLMAAVGLSGIASILAMTSWFAT